MNPATEGEVLCSPIMLPQELTANKSLEIVLECIVSFLLQQMDH